MADIYALYNKYIYINGKWELIDDSKESGATIDAVIKFIQSITAAQLANLDISSIDVNNAFNIIDSFVTDNRFIEGPGISVSAGTCIVVISQGNNKYFNILGRTFNIDYIQNQITQIQAEMAAIERGWDDISNKPFLDIGTGLDVDENGLLNAKQLLEDIEELQLIVSHLYSDWSHISGKPFEEVGLSLRVVDNKLEIVPINWSGIENKPFSSIGSGLNVNNSGELSANAVTWGDIGNKPFNTIGTGLSVSNGKLNAENNTWDSIQNKPFETYNGSDFTVVTYNGKQRLQINRSNTPYMYEISSYYMDELKNIIQS